MIGRKNSGFTLIEVLVVVAIVGILSAVAVPGYQSYVLKTFRANAQSYIMNLATQQEAYYLRNNQFASLAQLNSTGLLSDGVAHEDSDLFEGRYKITESTADNNNFSYQLEAINVQAKDTDCPSLSVDQDTLIKGLSADDLCTATAVSP